MKQAFFVVALLSLAAKPHQSTGISLDPRVWDVRYSSGVRLSSPWSFLFPSAPGTVNYVTTKYVAPMSQAQSISFSVRVDAIAGSPSFDYGLGVGGNNCVVLATVRAYIEATVPKGCPDATYTCAPDSARQWSNPIAIELALGTFTATTPLTLDQWSDAAGVRGVDNLSGFSATLSHPGMIGMTFGGGCFFGHGVNVSGGTARLSLLDFRIHS